jgi:CheY-like chemotaxis protein
MHPELDRILIVEDEADLREIFADVVRAMGTTVETAANGEEAIEKLDKMMPGLSLILCDITIPVMNGLDFLSSAITKYGYLPFVMLTAHSDHGKTTECLRLGAIDCLVKPFPPGTLKKNLPFWVEIGKRQIMLRSDPKYQALSKMESLIRVQNAAAKKTG